MFVVCSFRIIFITTPSRKTDTRKICYSFGNIFWAANGKQRFKDSESLKGLLFAMHNIMLKGIITFVISVCQLM